jgi:TatD DNase family protein
MELIDIGINLAHDSFDADRDAVMARARDAGVVQMVITGSSEESNARALALARAHPGRLYSTAGVHPHHAADLTSDSRPAIEAAAREPEVVAVGECGLDYFRDFSPRDLQRRAFGWQLEIATQLGKPVFLHQRDAHDDFLAILKEHRVTRIASPRARRSAMPISSSACTSGLPGGYVTSAAGCTCARSSKGSRPIGS